VALCVACSALAAPAAGLSAGPVLGYGALEAGGVGLPAGRLIGAMFGGQSRFRSSETAAFPAPGLSVVVVLAPLADHQPPILLDLVDRDGLSGRGGGDGPADGAGSGQELLAEGGIGSGRSQRNPRSAFSAHS